MFQYAGNVARLGEVDKISNIATGHKITYLRFVSTLLHSQGAAGSIWPSIYISPTWLPVKTICSTNPVLSGKAYCFAYV